MSSYHKVISHDYDGYKYQSQSYLKSKLNRLYISPVNCDNNVEPLSAFEIWDVFYEFNPLRPSDAYMRQYMRQ